MVINLLVAVVSAVFTFVISALLFDWQLRRSFHREEVLTKELEAKAREVYEIDSRRQDLETRLRTAEQDLTRQIDDNIRLRFSSNDIKLAS